MIDIIFKESDGVTLSTVNIAARQILRQHSDTTTGVQIYYALRDGSNIVTTLMPKKADNGMMQGIHESICVLPPSLTATEKPASK